MILKVEDNIYDFRFGLKGLIMLREMTEINVEENFTDFLLGGLITYQPNINYIDCKELILKLNSKQIDLIKNYIINYFQPLSELELAELYAKAVGEIGIQPSEFYSMTKEEINYAYDGYLHKKEIEANLVMTAINFAKVNSEKLIRLLDDKGYQIGNNIERQETFKALGIEVE